MVDFTSLNLVYESVSPVRFNDVIGFQGKVLIFVRVAKPCDRDGYPVVTWNFTRSGKRLADH